MAAIIRQMQHIFKNAATRAIDVHDVTNLLMRQFAAEGTQDSRNNIKNLSLVSHGANQGISISTVRFLQRIKEYMDTGGLVVVAPLSEGEVFEIPMHQLVQNRDWGQLMAQCRRYRMDRTVVQRTLDVFTVHFDTPEGVVVQPQTQKYAAHTNTPETTCDNLQACVDLIRLGFFNFVAGIMKAYDRDIDVTQKCIQVLYSMSTVMEHIARNLIPYVSIVDHLGTCGIGMPSANTEMTYRVIMIQYYQDMRPPSAMPTSGDHGLLWYAMAHIHNMIPGSDENPPLHAVHTVCDALVQLALANRAFLRLMDETVIGQVIGTTVKWLKMSLESTHSGHDEHQILALRFLQQLMLFDRTTYPKIIFKHGIAEVLLLGIGKNNARADALLHGHVADASEIMRNQFAFYDLMYTLMGSDVDRTMMVRDFCVYNGFEHVLETLRLAMDDASVFRFEFALPRSTMYRSVLPGVEMAPYKKRCDGVTSTFNIAELAVVLACKMSQPDIDDDVGSTPDAIFSTNLNAFKSADLNEILRYGCRSYLDNQQALKLENNACAMDRDSFRQRGVSIKHVHRLATSLGLHKEYIEMFNTRD